jgi:hypothetical protein
MPAMIRTWTGALIVLGLGLAGVGTACNVTIEVSPDGGDNTQVAGSDPGTTGGTTPPTGGSTNDQATPGSDQGNPNSPCSDLTNVYVSYVNKSSARVGFVENCRDDAYGVLAASIFVLEAAGQAGDTQTKCIACPHQAGVRNIKYIRDGVQTAVPYPSDLMRGSFQCGDNITFVFNENGTVSTQVSTP